MHSWDDIRFFLAVARTGSVSKAATKLGVNQTTVSRRIMAFETQLDVRLFERLATGHVLTPHGEALLPHAERIEEETLSFSRKLKGKNVELSGPVRCATSLVFLRYVLAPALKSFSEAFPKIEIQLDLSKEIYNLSQREVDVAFRVTRGEIPENLLGRQLGMATMGVYVHRSMKNSDNPSQSLPWIGEDDGLQRPPWLPDNFQSLRLVARCNDVLGTVDAIKARMGVGRLPRVIGDNEAELVRFTEGLLPPPVPVWVLSHPDLRTVSRIRVFREFICDYIISKSLIF